MLLCLKLYQRQIVWNKTELFIHFLNAVWNKIAQIFPIFHGSMKLATHLRYSAQRPTFADYKCARAHDRPVKGIWNEWKDSKENKFMSIIIDGHK